MDKLKKLKEYYSSKNKWYRITKIKILDEVQQNILLEGILLILLSIYLLHAYNFSSLIYYKAINYTSYMSIIVLIIFMILKGREINLSEYLNRTTSEKDYYIFSIILFLYLHLSWGYNLWVLCLLIGIILYYFQTQNLFQIHDDLKLRKYFLLSSIQPGHDDDFISNRGKQFNSLGKEFLYVPSFQSRIYKFSTWYGVDELLKLSSHVLLFWKEKESMSEDSPRLEWLFRKSFQNPHIVFDSFSLTYNDFEALYPPSYKEPFGRMSFLLKLIDEAPPPLENYVEKTDKKIMSIELNALKEPLLKELSLDVHKENDFLLKLLEEQGEKANYGISEILDSLSKNGIFELTLMYRQVFELNNSAARFLGFIDLLECTSLYMVSLLYSESPTGVIFWEKAEDSELESLTFGKCNTLLRKWLKGELKSDLSGIHLGLRSMLLHEFAGLQPLSKLKQFGEEGFGVNYSWTKEETLLDVLEFFSVIRNKTRGHGSPTKIPYYILPPLQMMILLIFKALSDIPGSIICLLKEEEQTFFLDLRSGGLPQFLSKINREKGEEEFDFSNIYDTEEDTTDRKQRTERANEIAIQPDVFEQIYWGNKGESWNLSKIIKYHDQRIYLLSDYKKKLYISHSSGDIVRPEQLQENRKKSSLNTIDFLKRSEGEDGYTLKKNKEILARMYKNFQSIPAGEFLMGAVSQDTEADSYEKPQHLVRINQTFHMGIYPVTQEEWKAVMGNNPSEFKRVGGRAPVESVSWDDIQEFLKKLNELAGLSSEKGYRLPTEAEWEYAARAGTSSIYIHGDDPSFLEEYAWFEKNSEKTTHTVEQKKPNAWGLYDMSGNVCEWCSDWYGEDYYEISPEIDPKGPDKGDKRILRGGSAWSEGSPFIGLANLKVSYRMSELPDNRSHRFGFRLVLPNS